jgi:sugar-specific transcriptional regulator TrmB/DNA-binding CsgD family transcriptional regulator
MLEPLGISPLASKLYVEAYKNPGRGLFALAQGLDIPINDANIAYAELERNSLILDGATSIFVAPPSQAVDLIMARQEAELQAKKAHAEGIKEEAQLARESGGVETILGMAAINERLRTLCLEAESEVSTFAPGGAHTPDQIANARQTDEQMFARNIQSRTIYLSSLRNDNLTLEHVRWLNSKGAEVRTTPSLPLRMIIQDKKTVVLPIDSSDTKKGIAIYSSKGVVAAMSALFDTYWVRAKPLGENYVPEKNGLSEEEKAILELLALGRGIEDVQKDMGLSGRTTRRKVEALMERIGARTKFEAGYLAVKRGLL